MSRQGTQPAVPRRPVRTRREHASSRPIPITRREPSFAQLPTLLVRAAEACSGHGRARCLARDGSRPQPACPAAVDGRIPWHDGREGHGLDAPSRRSRVCEGWRSIGHSPTASVQKQRRRPPPRTTTPGRPRHGRNRYRRRVVFPAGTERGSRVGVACVDRDRQPSHTREGRLVVRDTDTETLS